MLTVGYSPLRKYVQSSGTEFHNATLPLEYFWNTRASRPVGLKDAGSGVGGEAVDVAIGHTHDGWNSGPFRLASSRARARSGAYRKYTVASDDLIPVRDIWRTGRARCSSTAPFGPLKS